MTEAQQNLQKWLFYFDRFNNHEVSAKLDQELCERTDEKMVEVQETSQLSWIEVRKLSIFPRHQCLTRSDTGQVHAASC